MKLFKLLIHLGLIFICQKCLESYTVLLNFWGFVLNVIFFSDCLYFIGIYNNLIFMLILQILSILLLAGLPKYLSSLFTFSKFNSFFIECMYCSFTFHFNCCSDVHYFLVSTSLGFVFLRPWNASLRYLFEIFLLKIWILITTLNYALLTVLAASQRFW